MLRLKRKPLAFVAAVNAARLALALEWRHRLAAVVATCGAASRQVMRSAVQ